MSQTHDDPRVTAYVFGELPSDQMAAFERELEGSPKLKQEVAAIRDAVAALHFEFNSRGADVSQTHRRAVEDAIEQRAQQPAAPIAPATIEGRDRMHNRGAILALLAASVLLAVGLTYPYWNSQSSTKITMNESAIENPNRDPMTVPAASTSVIEDEEDETIGEMESFDGAAVTATEPSHAEGGGRLDALFGLGSRPGDSAEARSHAIELAGAGDSGAESSEPNLQLPPSNPSQPAKVDGDLMDDTASLGGYAGAPSAPHFFDDSVDAFSSETEAPAAASRRSRRGDQMGMEMDLYMDMDMDMGMGTDMQMGMSGPGQKLSSLDGLAVAGGVNRSLSERSERELEMGMGMMGGMMGAAGDRYAPIEDNPFVEVVKAPLSTFSIDVDTASYSKIRSLLRNNTLPRPDAVRIEELLNYFDYDYPAPRDAHPFAASMEIAQCPWNADHRLARIGIQAKEIEAQRPSSSLVFLLDVSGSMDEPAKLPLVIEGMKLLTDQLTENDKVAIVVYAGAAGVVLDATRGDKKQEITSALDRLRAGGSTNGGQGIVLAYQIARDHFITGGTNRVILCSDGDFNVGVTGTDELVRIAKENAGSNIFLSVLGFGTGNHNDAMMEKLSNDGNGNYAFIDSRREAEKVFVEELGGTLVAVAKDVKIQVEFNPKKVRSYRLIGYENRMLEARDFADDKKDAGEIGAGHTVTALYELVPAESDPAITPPVEDLRYQDSNRLTERADSNEVLILKLRYKQPEGDTSTLMEVPVVDDGKSFVQSDRDFQFATAVAAFGMLLRNSPHRGKVTFADVQAIASESAKGDDFGYRTEFVELVKRARALRGQ